MLEIMVSRIKYNGLLFLLCRISPKALSVDVLLSFINFFRLPKHLVRNFDLNSMLLLTLVT